MVTRTQIKEAGNRGPEPDELRAARLTRLALAAEEAFGASTLLEAQEALGAAAPELVTSITLSSDFDSPTGAAPQTTATRTITVPAGNPGLIVASIEQTGTAGTPSYDLAAAGAVGIQDGETIEADDTNTLDFTVSVGVGTTTIQLRDATTAAAIGSAFVITTT